MKKTIFIVDDNRAIREVIQIVLEENGYTVISNDGSEFPNIEMVKPDLVLLDISLSGIDGRDIAKEIKSTDSTRHIPIILMSALTKVESKAKKAGADDFLAKPFNIDHLLNKIEKYVH